MSLTLDTVREIMRSADPYDSKAGADCRWYGLGQTYKRRPIGVKMFEGRRIFSHCRYWHNWASKHGVGPKVYGSFKAEFGGIEWYCIAMEEVSMAYEHLRSYYAEFTAIKTRVTNKLKKLGVRDVRDIHPGNVGKSQVGKNGLVVIDFSRFNWRDDENTDMHEWQLEDWREEWREWA